MAKHAVVRRPLNAPAKAAAKASAAAASKESSLRVKYFHLILVVRWASALLYTTEFVPDEAWQSTEVAYYYTYGRGHLTWEWLVGLRNHIFPFCIAIIFKFLKFFGLDTPYALLIAPRLFQATITAVGDYAFFLTCVCRSGPTVAKWSLGVALTCWFTFYCGARTITNTTEMALNCVAMYLMETDQIAAMCGVVALNFMIRPTALVIWIPQIFDILRLFFPPRVQYRIPAALFLGLFMISVGSLLDSFVFRRPVLSWLRFIKFNFIEGQSAQFGEHHFLWYFYSAVPSIMGPYIIPLGLSLALRLHRKNWTVIFGFILCFSMIKHKEIRFLLPVLPYMFAIVGEILCKISELCTAKETEFYKSDNIDIRKIFQNVLLLVFIINLLAAAYFCQFHQGGVLQMTEYVNEAAKNIKNPQIWVMMQCYSVPVFTYMHNPNATFEFMTCGPTPVMGLELDQLLPNFRRYSPNATVLKDWISEKNSNSVPFPDFILCFEELAKQLVKIFATEFGKEYEVCLTRAHAQFGEDRGMANVLCKVNPPPPPPNSYLY